MLTSATLPSHAGPAGIDQRTQKRRRKFLALVKRADGWWLNAQALTPDVPLWGPWATKREAQEAAVSYRRNGLGQPSDH